MDAKTNGVFGGLRFRAQLMFAWYRFRHSFFRWKADSDGDITFRLAWFLHFTKYKEHTIFRVRLPSAMVDAQKWQGYSTPESAP